MELISKGGYSEVYYDPSKEEVYRRSYKYYPTEINKVLTSTSNHTQFEKHLDISIINDLIFTKSFEYTGHTPVTHSETICEKYISFRMPHYGKPMYQWVHDYPIDIRKRYAPTILMDIIMTCIYFEKNGFFHSDLKPSNIMIETVLHNPSQVDEENTIHPDYDIEKLKVRVIDFNSSSVRILDEQNRNIHWANAIGTWNYCAPEIILYERPENTSICWTIGLLAATLIDTYAFTDFVNKEMQNTLVPQNTWKRLFGELYMKYPNHPPLSRKDFYDEPWQKLIINCTHWVQSKRWSLGELYNYVYYQLLNDIDKLKYEIPYILYEIIQPIQYTIHIGKLTKEKRSQIIQLIYNLCVRIKQMYLFATAVTIFDRCECIIYDNEMMSNSNQIAGCSILLSACMSNVHILTSKSKLTMLTKFFAITHLDTFLHTLFSIGNYLQWKIWEKPAHIIVFDYFHKRHLSCLDNLTRKNYKVIWEYIRDGFEIQKDYYTQQMIADCVIERIQTSARDTESNHL